MYKAISTLILLFALGLYSFCIAQESKTYVQDMNIFVEQSASAALKKLPKLKTTISAWLSYDSIRNSTNRDFVKMYPLLSKNYLSNNFPKVTSASEYFETMQRGDEIYFKHYLSIESLEFKSKRKVLIVTTCIGSEEGVTYIIKKGKYFVEEQGLWKFDGIEPNIHETTKL